MLPGGISMMMPSDAVTSVGVPQPSLAIGPMRNVPCSGGKNRLQVADDLRGVGDDVCGNITLSIDPVRTPSAICSSFIVRLSPSSPPTPMSVNPKPSWIGVPNSAVMMISSEKPSDPSGIRVVMMPIALSERNPEKTSSSAPAYSPFSKSR